jgi:hypothetical protein
MNRIFKMFAVSLMSLVLLFGPLNANAVEVTSGPASTVSLSMSIAESITVSATPANVTFTYSSAGGGTATASGPITINLAWNMAPSGHPGGVIAESWLGSATAALSGPQSIPSSQVFQAINGLAALPCTNSVAAAAGFGVAGAECGIVGTSPIPVAGTGSRENMVVLSLSGLGLLTPGTYTGTYNVEAYVL